MILILSNYLEPPLLNNELNSKSSNILNYVYVLNQFHFEGTVVQMIITSYLISENISCLKKLKRNSTSIKLLPNRILLEIYVLQ